MNNVNLVSRLTKSPESRGINENKVCVYTLAVNRKFTNQEGKRDADFIQIKAFKGLGDNCSRFLSKGSLVAVEASIRTGSYEKDGKNIFTMEVIANDVRFLEGKKSQNEQSNNSSNQNYRSNQNSSNDDPFPGSVEINTGNDWPFA